MARILITGGAGYIGSHVVVDLVSKGHVIAIVDNFCNSSPSVIRNLMDLTKARVQLYELDVRDTKNFIVVARKFAPEVIVHLAGLKSVGESERIPLDYYSVNVTGTESLLQCMDSIGCKKLVFSSSATVYGKAEYLPLDEYHPCVPTSVYGRTKWFAENIVADWQRADIHRSAVCLRYFNPVGAHNSGLIGENPSDPPNNLVPILANVALGKTEKLKIFGNDFETDDGTGERDFIHIEDLARAHSHSVEFISSQDLFETINIGTGQAYTVIEMVRAYADASNRDIPYVVTKRRDGDIATSVAQVEKAHRLLSWQASKDLMQMCASDWYWRVKQPKCID